MKKGVLLIAAGNAAYLQMAKTLLASIRLNDPALPVALATDKPPVTEVGGLFDILIQIPREAYVTNEQVEWIKAKTYMYDLSPFKETIFLDVDMILLQGRKLSPFFDHLAEVDWTIANTGPAAVSIWADISEVKAAYKTDNPFYNYHSEFVYFKKGKEAAKYFSMVKKIFANPRVKGTQFGGARIADELAFQIASMVLNKYPHEDHFTPTFWWARDKKNAFLYPYQIPADMVAYSIGGHNLPDHVKSHYNNLAAYYFSTLGMQSPYRAVAKRLYLPHRKNA